MNEDVSKGPILSTSSADSAASVKYVLHPTVKGLSWKPPQIEEG